MKKIFKLLFSRLSLTILTVIVQLAFYIFIPWLIGREFPYIPINLILSIISVFLVILIINSDMKIEGQLPIIILCIIAPFIGVLICFVFIAPNIPRKFKKNFFYTKNQINESLAVSSEEKEELVKLAGDKYDQFNYIFNVTGLRCYKNTDIEYYDIGEKFFEKLKEELSKAKKYIFMEYFIIENGVMWGDIYEILKKKVEEGVDVRLMYDDLGTMVKLPSNFAKKLKKDGIKCVKFNAYSSATSSIYNNRDHRKITVVDGLVGFIGGVNIADEYINVKKPFGHFKDSAVKITGDAVKNLICLFMQLYSIQTKVLENYSDYFAESEVKSDSIVCPFGDGPKYFYGEQVSENVFINMISQAKKSVYITTPYLIIDNKLRDTLINASHRGVSVKIVTPHIPDKKIVFSMTRSNYKPLLDNGIEIFEYKPGFIHEKQVLVDDELAVVGTINFDYRSLIHHYECGVLMYRCDSLKDIKKDFENLFAISVSMNGYKQNIIAKLFCALIKLFMPLF